MSLISLVIVLIVVGVLVWLINQAPFIDAKFKTIINYLILVVVVLWILSLFLPGVDTIRIGRVP